MGCFGVLICFVALFAWCEYESNTPEGKARTAEREKENRERIELLNLADRVILKTGAAKGSMIAKCRSAGFQYEAEAKSIKDTLTPREQIDWEKERLQEMEKVLDVCNELPF